MQRNQRTHELKEYKSAEELRQRREEAEKIMAQVEQLKQAKGYDKAIALCRQAMEVLPTSPTAYLKGGRLLINKKHYPPTARAGAWSPTAPWWPSTWPRPWPELRQGHGEGPHHPADVLS